MEVIKLRDEYIKLGQALKGSRNREFRCDCQACDTGRSSRGKWQSGISKRQEALCRRCCHCEWRNDSNRKVK